LVALAMARQIDGYNSHCRKIVQLRFPEFGGTRPPMNEDQGLIAFAAVEVMNLYVSKLCKATLNISAFRSCCKENEKAHAKYKFSRNHFGTSVNFCKGYASDVRYALACRVAQILIHRLGRFFKT